MLFKKPKRALNSQEVLKLKAGDDHYRAFIGPPRDYDLISAMVFNLLTCAGLRQEHRILDIGCGSLRVGRLLIPYLSPDRYIGIEPNKWLVTEGVNNEVGRDLQKIKRPRFIFGDSLSDLDSSLNLNFAFAQSIFSHCGIDLIGKWLDELTNHLRDDGALLATFLISDEDFGGDGWVYPDCVEFRVETIAALAEEHGYRFKLLNWAHPRQSWGLFYRADFDDSLTRGGNIYWDRVVKSRYPNLEQTNS